MNFQSATLLNKHQETPQCWHIELAGADPAWQANYTVPGQYVFLRLPGHPEAVFAFSSAPFNKHASFLVKKSSRLTEALVALKEGDTVEVSEVDGLGFDIQKIHNKHVLLFAAGSGIAPLRAVIQNILRNRYQYGKITLYYGARNPNEFAYAHEFHSWIKQGIRIRQTISNKNTSDWKQNFGYVQQMIDEELPGPNTAALLCGMKGMVEGVREKLVKCGIPNELILVNF